MNLEGRNPVLESLRSGRNQLREIYLRDKVKKDEKIYEIVRLAKKHKIKLRFVQQDFLNKISDTGKHQGVIAVRAALPTLSLKEFMEQAEIENRELFLVYIRESFNEFNIGSIIRTAECTGAHAVVLTPKTKVTPQVIRAAMGASEHINIIHESLFNAIKLCKDHSVKVIGIEVAGEKYYYEADLTGSAMFIIGGEDRSLSEPIMEKCDEVVFIPLKGQVNSLNMGVAAGVVMYEKVRQEETLNVER